MKTFYVTTPIYYVNDVPHIGHAYTTIAADVLSRWKRLCGEKVFFLTGTDEHGQNIERIAREKGVPEQTICDTNAVRFKELWEKLGITNDDFIRTTEERHKRGVVALWNRLKTAKTPAGNSAVFKKKYTGLYCPRCEAFKTEDELKQPGDVCPDHGQPCEWTEEENYFFRLSDYGDWFREILQNGTMKIEPESRRNEVMSVVQQGLQDFSISRARVKWGIKIPDDPGHVFYVWMDALSNYITALGFAESGDKREPYETFWAKGDDRLHLIGKEIIRFHCLYWPGMLYAAGVPIPTRVFAHGWWTVEGEKMSKTRGNVIDPHTIAAEYSVDVLRYFVLREVPFGNDGDFSRKSLLNRYNADLANALGNLLNRTLNLLEVHFEGHIPYQIAFNRSHDVEKIKAAMERLFFNEALEQTFLLVYEGNTIMDKEAPWKTVKTDRAAAGKTLSTVLANLKQAAILLQPYMPSVTIEMWKQMGEKEKDFTAAAKQYLAEGSVTFAEGQTVQKGAPLFPRKDVASRT